MIASLSHFNTLFLLNNDFSLLSFLLSYLWSPSYLTLIRIMSSSARPSCADSTLVALYSLMAHGSCLMTPIDKTLISPDISILCGLKVIDGKGTALGSGNKTKMDTCLSVS